MSSTMKIFDVVFTFSPAGEVAVMCKFTTPITSIFASFAALRSIFEERCWKYRQLSALSATAPSIFMSTCPAADGRVESRVIVRLGASPSEGGGGFRYDARDPCRLRR